MNPLVVHLPVAAFQLGGDPPPAIRRHLQGDLLNLVPQIHVTVLSFRLLPMTIEASPAHGGGVAHVHNRHGRFPFCFLVDFLEDGAVELRACSIRASSTRCKTLFKKSISSVCWPIFR